MRLADKVKMFIVCVNYRTAAEYKIAYFIILAAKYIQAQSQVACVGENVSICYFEKAIWAGNCC